MYSSEQSVKQNAKKILDDYNKNTGHVFNLGHGIHPGIDPNKVKALVDFVHDYGAELRRK